MLNVKDWSPETFRTNEAECTNFLKDYNNWRDIPLLNHIPLHELKDGYVVRFRGMIQDMFNPEMYLEEYEVKRSDASQKSRMQNGKYRDCFVLKSDEYVDHDSTSNSLGERRVMFVISVPGTNKWVHNIENGDTRKWKDCALEKSDSKGQKRNLENPGNEMEIEAHGDCNSLKKTKTESNSNPSGSNSIISSEYLLNSPILERPSKACMVKIYSDLEEICLNTVIDVVGFLSVDPSLDASTVENSDEFMDINEMQATNPPPSLIPRLHAIAIKRLEHINPLLDVTITDNVAENVDLETLRNDIKRILTQCLFGDDIAAEYLISHLISRVYVRTNFEAIGQFTLNISNIPTAMFPEYTEKLYEILELLLPASHYFPMTLDNMNTIQFVPKKDYKTNRLTSGLLQLASHTHLVLDETRLQTGKLESGGVIGMQSFSHLIKTKQIKYDFEFYKLDFNADIPILILSEGKSMLPNNFHIPLDVNSESCHIIMETLKAAKHYLQPKLNDIRKYLTMSRLRNFSMNPTDSQMIENDFVEMRQLDGKVGAEELHSLLILTRYTSITRGKDTLDQQSWKFAKQLEEVRKTRINNNSRIQKTV